MFARKNQQTISLLLKHFSQWKISNFHSSKFSLEEGSSFVWSPFSKNKTLPKITPSNVAKILNSVQDHKEERMIWVDLEMTGLDVEKDQIIEMACLITDSNLNIVAEAPEVVIYQPNDILDKMDDWNRTNHGKSGLIERVKSSKISLPQAEEIMLEFVEKHTVRGRSPLAGNSIHVDKKFIDKHMPKFSQHLHWRIIDISTLNELCKRWFRDEALRIPKSRAHRALLDIKESLRELQYYRDVIFRK